MWWISKGLSTSHSIRWAKNVTTWERSHYNRFSHAWSHDLNRSGTFKRSPQKDVQVEDPTSSDFSKLVARCRETFVREAIFFFCLYWPDDGMRGLRSLTRHGSHWHFLVHLIFRENQQTRCLTSPRDGIVTLPNFLTEDAVATVVRDLQQFVGDFLPIGFSWPCMKWTFCCIF